MIAYQFPAPANLCGDDLSDQVQAAGLPRPNVIFDSGNVRLVFPNDLTQQQQARLAQLVAAHAPAPVTPEQRVDRAGMLRPRVLAALVLLNSSSWASMTQVEKNRVQAIIDDAGVATLAALRG